MSDKKEPNYQLLAEKWPRTKGSVEDQERTVRLAKESLKRAVDEHEEVKQKLSGCVSPQDQVRVFQLTFGRVLVVRYVPNCWYAEITVEDVE